MFGLSAQTAIALPTPVFGSSAVRIHCSLAMAAFRPNLCEQIIAFAT